MSYDYSENKLVQDSIGNLLHNNLVRETKLAYYNILKSRVRSLLKLMSGELEV